MKTKVCSIERKKTNDKFYERSDHSKPDDAASYRINRVALGIAALRDPRGVIKWAFRNDPRATVVSAIRERLTIDNSNSQ